MNKIETQDIQCEHPLTYHDFFERFNAVSLGYHACPFIAGGVVIGVAIISDYDYNFMAALGSRSHIWDFYNSSFRWKELNLMAQLAATVPEFRGEVNNAD